MTKEITTQININAAPEKVWSVLTDFKNYPDWNPFIRSVSGRAEVNNTIKVEITPPGGKRMVFRPVVIARTEGSELKWKGRLFFRGLFDGEHRFRLRDNEDGTTTFFHGEKFTGILVGLISLEATKAGFELMNRELKERVERL